MRIKVKKPMRIMAFVLSIIMFVVSLPMTAFAMVEDNMLENPSVKEELSPMKDVTVLEEDKSLREESVKHFNLSDGTTKAVVYPQAVHYKDSEEKWIDIDNTLILINARCDLTYL